MKCLRLSALAIGLISSLCVVHWSQAATIVSTTTVSVSATVGGPEESSSSSSSTQNGAGAMVGAQLILTGRAYPEARLTLWRNGLVMGDYGADLNAEFRINLTELQSGWLNLAIYARDAEGGSSMPYILPIWISPGAITTVDGIVIGPTLSISRLAVNRGGDLRIFGQTRPNSQVMIKVRPVEKIVAEVAADNQGRYSYDWREIDWPGSNYQVWSSSNGLDSPWRLMMILAGRGNQEPETQKPCQHLRADLNGDCKVNLIDFSVLAYWYKKSKPPVNLDLQANGVIDLADFSIMAYYWTG